MNSSNNHISDIGSHTPSWVSRLEATDLKAILEMFSKTDPQGLPFSNIDLFFTNGLTTEDIRKKIFEMLDLKDTKNNKQTGIKTINTIYTASIEYMERVLLRKFPLGFKRNWSSIEEFISAVDVHTKRNINGAYSLMFCALLKVMIVEAGLYENESIEELDTDMLALLKKVRSIEGLTVPEPKKGSQEIFLSYKLDGIYSGKLEYRPKSRDSIRTKLIYNRKYPAVNNFRDLLAMRFEINKHGAVHTILKIRNGLYGNSAKVKFEVKGGILSADEIEELKLHNIDIEIVKTASKGESSLKYEDAKFTGSKIKIVKGSKVKYITPEIQFVLPNNKNESGFSEHTIYDLKKILSANARLFGGLTTGNIAYILKEYQNRTDIDPKKILEHLLYPQDSTKKPFLYILIRKSARTGKNKIYFTTSDVYNRESGKTMKHLYDYPQPLNIHGATFNGELQELVHKSVNSILRASSSNP